MLVDTLHGVGSALAGLFFSAVAWGFAKLGRELACKYRKVGDRWSLPKAYASATIIAATLGALMATPRAERDDSDYMFGGDVTGYVNVLNPAKRFSETFVFLAGAMAYGIGSLGQRKGE